MRLLVALGGNALLPRGARPDAAAQVRRIAEVAPALARLAADHELIVTHGNGPQVGLLAVESAADPELSRPYPFDALVAETQGMIGYWLQQALVSAGAGEVVTVVTQTVVDTTDPAFGEPAKFVGAVMTADAADRAARDRGWIVQQDGDAWRRVVPSPTPRRVVETSSIDALVARGVTVVCAGGGGSPVVESNGVLRGVQAVVDKDAVAALLGQALRVDRVLLLTDVPAVMLGWGTADEHPLADVAAADLRRMTFAAGSMGPKVDACCRFAEATGRTASIGSLDAVADLLARRVGTHVHR